MLLHVFIKHCTIMYDCAAHVYAAPVLTKAAASRRGSGGKPMFDLQKASMLKRASAWLLDVILLSVLATGFALLLSAAFGYDNYNNNLQRYYTEYEQLYGIDFNISDEEYLALGEEDRLRYADAYAKLNDDAEVSRAFSIIIQLSLAIMSLSVLLAYMALEFAIPVLWLKNGQKDIRPCRNADRLRAREAHSHANTHTAWQIHSRNNGSAADNIPYIVRQSRHGWAYNACGAGAAANRAYRGH